MRRAIFFLLLLGAAAGSLFAAAKPRVIAFGKTSAVKWFVGPAEQKGMELKIRPLYVDGKLREFTIGEPHDVTDRIFVVRRAFRVNDYLPEDSKTIPRWKWQRGGWLSVDRLTGRVSRLNLPEFDEFYSAASWYRDLVAYCGVSSNAEKLFAVVAQLGRKKPIVRKEVGAAHGGDLPDSECTPPRWQRQPARVTFQPLGGAPLTFEVHTSGGDTSAEAEGAETNP